LVAGLFFFRFYRRTSDALFVAFGIAFCLLALSHALVAFSGIVREEQNWTFLLRLAAFALIITAIIGKNIRLLGPR
jgi:uncharacterized membrane protein HdeD (DUF308 family)